MSPSSRNARKRTGMAIMVGVFVLAIVAITDGIINPHIPGVTGAENIALVKVGR